MVFSKKCSLGFIICPALVHSTAAKHTLGVISEGQITKTRLCSPTIAISENCLRSTTNVFDEKVNQLWELFQLP